MCLISQQNTNPIDCSKKSVVGESTKGNCFVSHEKNEKSPKIEALKILTCLIVDLKDPTTI